MIERGAVIDAEVEACRAAVWLQRNCEAGGGTLVLLQDAADLPVHRRRVEPLLRTSDASGQAFERRFNPPAELVMHGPFFAAPIGRAAQNHGLPRLGIMVSLTSTPSWTVRQPSAAASSELNLFSSDFGAPMI